MKKTFLLFLAILPLFAFTAHKFYVSNTDVSYNEKTRSLEIISRVFIDDMEELLKKRYDKDLYLLKDGEHEKADAYLEKYLKNKLNITVDGKEKQLNYIGKEYDNDQLILYLEAPKVEPFQKITVENLVLSDLFPEQKNVIKVEKNGKIKSLLLGLFEPQGTLKFSK